MANAYCLKDLRWLLCRGSPLPFPNREVKPGCADGTAVMWESRSPPSFENPFNLIERVFCFEISKNHYGFLISYSKKNIVIKSK